MKLTNSRSEYLKAVSQILPKNPVCVEIGVHKGEFSKMILSELQPEKLFLIDPWEIGYDKNDKQTYDSGLPTAYSTENDFKFVFNQFYDEIRKNKVVMRADYSYNIVNDFPNNYFDFVYIDSCHLYNAVKADLNMFLPKLKENGLLCGHDYFKGVIEHGLIFGVVEAVDEFCIEKNFEMIILNNLHGNFDWTLKKIN